MACWYQCLLNLFLIHQLSFAIVTINLHSTKILHSSKKKLFQVTMPMHITLDCPDTKNLWEKSFKYTVNVDSNHPTDTLSLKVPIFKSGFWDLLLIWRREFEKIWCLKDWNTMPANLITNRRIFHNGKGLGSTTPCIITCKYVPYRCWRRHHQLANKYSKTTPHQGEMICHSHQRN